MKLLGLLVLYFMNLHASAEVVAFSGKRSSFVCDEKLIQKTLHDRFYRLALRAGIPKQTARTIELKLRKIEDEELVFNFIHAIEKNLNREPVPDLSLRKSIDVFIKNEFESLNDPKIGLNSKISSEQRQRLALKVRIGIDSQQKLETYYSLIKQMPLGQQKLFLYVQAYQNAHFDAQNFGDPETIRDLKLESMQNLIEYRLEPHVRSELDKLRLFYVRYSDAKKASDPAAYDQIVDISFAIIFLWGEITPAENRVVGVRGSQEQTSQVVLLSKLVWLTISEPESRDLVQEILRDLMAQNFDIFLETRATIVSGQAIRGVKSMTDYMNIESSIQSALHRLK